MATPLLLPCGRMTATSNQVTGKINGLESQQSISSDSILKAYLQQAVALTREKEPWHCQQEKFSKKREPAHGNNKGNNPLVAIVGDKRQWHSHTGAMAECRGAVVAVASIALYAQ